MKKPEILFVLPPGIRKSQPIFEHYLGAAYIQAYLKEEGVESRAYVRKKPGTIAEIVSDIVSYQAPIVGFTCYDTNYYFVKILAEAIKTTSPSTLIIAGGPTPTMSDGLIMEDCLSIDVCFRGEAEQSVLQFLNHPRDKWECVDGITFRQGDDIVRNRPAVLASSGIKGAELDLFPSPFLTGVIQPGTMDTLLFLTFRGCPYHCIYCSFPSVSSREIRHHSIGRVMEELHVIKELTTLSGNPAKDEMILESDNYFNINLSRAKEICRQIIDEELNLQFITELRADNVDIELLHLMKKAGFISVNLGLETAVPEILKIICKVRHPDSRDPGLKPEITFLSKVKHTVDLSKQADLDISVSIIHGLPGEGLDEARQTQRFLEELDITYMHNYLQVFHGTRLFGMRQDYGIGTAPSATLFPLTTSHAFNVSSVPQGKHSYNSSMGRHEFITALSAIWGIAGQPDPKESASGAIAVLPSLQNWSSGEMTWLRDNLSFCTLMLFGCPEFEDPELRDEYLFRISKHQIPSQNVYFLDSGQNGQTSPFRSQTPSRIWRSSLCLGSCYQIPRGVRRINFDRLPGSEPSDIPREQLIASFGPEPSSTTKDLTDLTETELMKLMIIKKAILADGCRWDTRQCPAVNLQRIIIDPDKSIYPCLSGECVGCVGETLESIRTKMTDRLQAVQKERGCETCPVNGTCAQCLFPAPFTTVQYCQMQRSGQVRNGVKNAQGFIQLLWHGTKKNVSK